MVSLPLSQVLTPFASPTPCLVVLPPWLHLQFSLGLPKNKRQLYYLEIKLKV
jgi:hypothetical protein